MSTPETSIPAAETAEPPEKPASTWYLTRFVLLRFLGFVYAVAFLIAALQILPLIGEQPRQQCLVGAVVAAVVAAYVDDPVCVRYQFRTVLSNQIDQRLPIFARKCWNS